MCYHASKTYSIEELHEYYELVNTFAFDKWQRFYHENGFDHNASPALVAGTGSLSNLHWGLIPWYTKTMEEALTIRVRTLNCISEEMYDKPSFRDAAKDGKRCLIPFTGFFEWRWEDAKGKEKTPHYIFLKNQRIFSVAGIWSGWKDRANNTTAYTYAVLTTQANKLMEEIHNSKKRMPVIIPREYEKDWLSSNLTKEDVLALCRPFDTSLMDAYPISKRITNKKEPTNVPGILEKVEPFKSTLF